MPTYICPDCPRDNLLDEVLNLHNISGAQARSRRANGVTHEDAIEASYFEGANAAFLTIINKLRNKQRQRDEHFAEIIIHAKEVAASIGEANLTPPQFNYLS